MDTAAFLTRRLAASLLLLLLILSATFLLLHAAPGDPADLLLEERLPPAQRAHLRHLYGLDRPLTEQYGSWLGGVVLRGDLGVSLVQSNRVTARDVANSRQVVLTTAAVEKLEAALGA